MNYELMNYEPLSPYTTTAMARLDDWLALANSTIRSLDGKQVSGLYSMEWPEAKRSLVAEYEEEIEKEPRRGVRYARFASALLYGLIKRLAPTRRVLFAASLVLIIIGLVHVTQHGTALTNLLLIGSSFLIMIMLLGLELIDKLKYRDELELARELQAGLIPELLPDHPAFEMAAVNRIANMVGGDIYDFVRLPDDRLAVLFGDASGHGMAAGLVMAVTQASFRTQLEIDPEPQTIIASLNRILCRVGGPRSFFAGVYLLITPEGELRTIVAGHPPILRLDAGGSVIDRIGEGAYPLGIRPDRQWPTLEGRLQPGESLLLHSDGLAEARSESGADYGFDRVERVIGRAGGSRPQNIVSLLLHDWETFRGNLPVQDDLSIAVIRRR
jgi:serine phosphatase RsbU (regulator of sigma subunit)